MVQNSTKPDREVERRALGSTRQASDQQSLGIQNDPELYKTRQETGQESLGTQNGPEWYNTRQESGQESFETQKGTKPKRKVVRRDSGVRTA